jgi:hypothetical protein
LKVEIVIVALLASWDYVIDGIGFPTALLASVTVTLKDTFTNLSPLLGAAIVFECACH